MVYNFFDKKSAATCANKSTSHKGTGINSVNQQLADQLHKSIIKNFEKRKVYSSFKDNIRNAHL